MRIDQTAFVNVSIFDRNYIEALFGGVQYPDGTYVIDCVEELIEHQKLFMEVVSQIRSENMFTFPVLTYSLLYRDGKFVDEEFARWCSDHNVTWNDSNFFISGDVNTLSNCCRLLSDTSKLNAFINSIGGTALSIGSVKVNTINLMRIALETECDEKKYLALLKKRALLCCKTLDTVRHIIKRNVEKGLLPNYQDGAVEMDKQYCTMGILGLYEVIEAFGYERMRVKTIVDEDFTNYKKPAMFIGTISCGGKCCIEAGIPLSVCQNDGWRASAPISIDDEQLCLRYLNNPLTESIVFGGLEPLEQFDELCSFLEVLRSQFQCKDDVVIYTGYYFEEVPEWIQQLATYGNVIVKFGRYIPNQKHIFDEVLGVELASDNQYAERFDS